MFSVAIIFYVFFLLSNSNLYNADILNRITKSRLDQLKIKTSIIFAYLGKYYTCLKVTIPIQFYLSNNFIISLYSIKKDNNNIELLNYLDSNSSFSVIEEDEHVGFIVLYQNIFVESDIKLRAILQFGSPFHPINKDIPNSFTNYSTIPELMDEINLNNKNDYNPDNYNIEQWIHPNISLNENNKYSDFINFVNICFINAKNNLSKLTSLEILRDGMSGIKFRHFMNNLGSMNNAIYLEVGVYRGSTLFSMIKDNQDLMVVAIDAWDTIPENSKFKLFHKENLKIVKEEVLINVDNIINTTNNTNIHIVVGNCWEVSSTIVYEKLNKLANIYFYDGPHSLDDQFLALAHYLSSLDEVFLFIVDDWNLKNSQIGTYKSIELLNLHIIAEFIIFPDVVNPEMFGLLPGYWHNGMAAFIISQTIPKI